jgi:hypothetical protein
MPAIHAAASGERFATASSVGPRIQSAHANAAQRDFLSPICTRIVTLSPPFPSADAMLLEWIGAIQFSLADEHQGIRLFCKSNM